jgi:deoxyribodipyrimidine photo-lyase
VVAIEVSPPEAGPQPAVRLIPRQRAVWWIKRDLRLTDNAALVAALESASEVMPVFIEEPSFVAANDTSAMHIHAWRQGLAHLRASLQKRGADLVFIEGETVEALDSLHRRFPISSIHSHEEIGDNRSYQRDLAVQAWAKEHDIAYSEYPQSSVRRSGINRDQMGAHWKQRIIETPLLPTVQTIPQSPELQRYMASVPLPALPAAGPLWQPVGERSAHNTLQSFLTLRGRRYSGGISSPNTAFDFSSRLSVHLSWGTVNVRQVYQATQTQLHLWDDSEAPEAKYWRRSLRNFQSRLHWRDHFIQRLETDVSMEYQAIHPAFHDLEYENDPKLLQAWAEGRTGFPLVDAVMRCLAATGYMNFRMRAMTTSFACHALHLSWQYIHPHLGGVFRDYEPGIHFSQLQMQAGVVGINTIRVYSPMKQLLDQDPQCLFVKRWIPELKNIAPAAIQTLGEEPQEFYYAPVVHFRERANQMRDRLYAIHNSPEARALAIEVRRKHGSRSKPIPRRRPTVKKPAVQALPGLFDE